MLRGVLAQRLVRKVCPHCKEAHAPDAHTQNLIRNATGQTVNELFRGEGCSRCRGTGYAGRVGVFELFIPDDMMLEKIAAGVTLQVLRAIAAQSSHAGLREDGLAKAISGITTVDEVIRATSI